MSNVASTKASQPRSVSWNPYKVVERKVFELKRNIWSTFAFGMLEPWEIILVLTFVSVISGLLWYSLYFHFPSHIRVVLRRTAYYIYGSTPSFANATSSATVLSAESPVPAAVKLAHSEL